VVFEGDRRMHRELWRFRNRLPFHQMPQRYISASLDMIGRALKLRFHLGSRKMADKMDSCIATGAMNGVLHATRSLCRSQGKWSGHVQHHRDKHDRGEAEQDHLSNRTHHGGEFPQRHDLLDGLTAPNPLELVSIRGLENPKMRARRGCRARRSRRLRKPTAGADCNGRA